MFDWLARGGVKRVDVCIGHLGELIQTYFSQAETIPSRLDVSWRREPEALGTAGALQCVPDVEETLLVVNGDIVTDLNVAEMLAFHRSRGAALTIATQMSEVETDLGVIEHEQGLVVNYREKPVLSYTASMGIYLYEPRVLQSLPTGPLQFPDLVLTLLARGEPVAAFQSDAVWQHIGTLTQHQEAHRRLEDPLPPP